MSKKESLNAEYRPKKFKDVVGQKKAVKILRNSILKKNIKSAYILDGETGCGKTTDARIFANALICRNRKDGEPCGECDACKTYEKNPELVDIIEIDAGENRGIDSIRALKEGLKYPPKEAYKIYIIDEFHQLTKEGISALLKPIEEPPEGVVFLLLTNEYDKILPTIRNRCVRVRFNKVAIHLIVKRLREICDDKGIAIENELLVKIAVSSKGVLREAISILEEVWLTASGNEIVEEDLIGSINIEEEYIKNLIYLILNGKTVDIMDCIDENESSISVNDFDYMIARLKKYLYSESIDLNSLKLISEIINILIEYKNKVIYNMSIKTLIELACIDSVRLCSENSAGAKWLIDNLSIQELDLYSRKEDENKQKKKEKEVKLLKSEKDSKEQDNKLISKDKAELFRSLMNIKFKEFEQRFGRCDLELDENNVLTFVVDSVQDKKDITAYLKRMYSQDLKPICQIEGFIVRVR